MTNDVLFKQHYVCVENSWNRLENKRRNDEVKNDDTLKSLGK